MSKMDNLRAMREAKYADAQKRAAAAPARPTRQGPGGPGGPRCQARGRAGRLPPTWPRTPTSCAATAT